MNQAARRVGQFALATALSIAAFHMSGLFGIFFLLPLQWIRSRFGEAPFVGAAVVAFAGIAGVLGGIGALVHEPWTPLETAFLSIPGTALAGWVAIVLLQRTGWRFLYRVLLVTGVAAVVLFPLASSLQHDGAFLKALEDGYNKVWTGVLKLPGIDAAATNGFDSRALLDQLKQAVLCSFLSVFFLFWMFTGRLAKNFETGGARNVLKNFRVPPQGALALLGLWGLLLVRSLLHSWGINWDWGFGQYVLLNLALVALWIYVLAGLGIIEALMVRWSWPGFVRIAVRLILVLLLVPLEAEEVPTVGQFVVLVGLPLLAVMELWMNLRTRTQEVGQ
jgi:hypothetical protein